MTAVIVWVPPSRQWLDRSDLVRAGNLAGMPVLVPGEGDRIEADRFADGFHLDALGAQQWTGVLMPRLGGEGPRTAVSSTEDGTAVHAHGLAFERAISQSWKLPIVRLAR